MIVPLTPSLSVVTFDKAACTSSTRARLGCELNNGSLPAPYVATSLDLQSGGQRHVLFVGQPLSAILERRLLLRLDGQAVASIEPNWLQPLLGDVSMLIDDLTARARRQLLKLLLTTGASLFAAGAATEFVAAVRGLCRLCGAEVCEPVAHVAAGHAHRILTYRLPPLVGTGSLNDPLEMGRARMGRATGIEVLREVSDGDDLLHLHVPQLPTDTELVFLADAAPLLLRAPKALRLRSAPVWLEERGIATRSWALGRIRDIARADAGARALLREMAAGSAWPEVVVRHLSATTNSVLYAVDISDPHCLIRGIRLERGGRRALVVPRLRVDGAGTVAGSVPLCGLAQEGETCHVELVLHSGRVRTILQAPLAPFDGSVPPGFEAAWRQEAVAGRSGPELALAQAQLGTVRDPVRVQLQSFGTAPSRIALSVVTSVGDNLDVIRARAALLARERGARHAEIIYLVEEGAWATAARRVVADAATVFGLSHQITTVACNTNPAERFRAGLAQAAGGAVLALGPEVLPAQEGWLPSWCRQLGSARGKALVGGTIRRADGSSEKADAISTDCAGLTRVGVDHILRSALPHPDPALLLAELNLAERKAGRPPAIDVRQTFIRYGVAPRITRFEAAARDCALHLLAERRDMERSAP